MYAKLFSSLLSSSIWSEDSDTCKVWITLIALADREGYVFGSVAGIARICALPVEKIEEAMTKFISPDRHSADLNREPERDGSRIEAIDGGWRLINYEYYRDLVDADVRRAQYRQAQRKRRQKMLTVNKRHHRSSSVIPSEAESSSSSESPSEKTHNQRPTADAAGDDTFSAFWAEYPRKVGKGKALETWEKLSSEERAAAVKAVPIFAECWKGAPETNLQFLAYPTTWLNQRRWTDDPKEWVRQAFRDYPDLLSHKLSDLSTLEDRQFMAKMKAKTAEV